MKVSTELLRRKLRSNVQRTRRLTSQRLWEGRNFDWPTAAAAAAAAAMGTAAVGLGDVLVVDGQRAFETSVPTVTSWCPERNPTKTSTPMWQAVALV